ncbi:MAG: hypothetical protein HY890_04490 [Deltaproteobacteria bacterium]|nr:hypothetical protein [Deltaproteobacteria bacterium]
MRRKLSGFIFILTALAVMGAAARAEHLTSEFVKKFRAALYERNEAMMTFIVEENRDNIPAAVKALIDSALLAQTTADEREEQFYVAESLANEYKNVSGDMGPLKEAKKRIFESRLSPPARPAAINGIHVVQALSTEKTKNVFMPGSIIIKKGETVRWVNNDAVAHLLASMPVIGAQGIFSPRVEPGQRWEYKFDAAGEYYYICFIHKVMYGKITVEE